MRILATILVALATRTAHGQSGVIPCVQGPANVATIVVSPEFPSSQQRVSISVSPGDHDTITAIFSPSVTASVKGQAIEVTLDAPWFPRGGPFHVNGHCGVVNFDSLPGGVYDVFFVLSLHPGLPFVAATTTLTVSDPSLQRVPASGVVTIAAMVLSVLGLAYLRLRTHRVSFR